MNRRFEGGTPYLFSQELAVSFETLDSGETVISPDVSLMATFLR